MARTRVTSLQLAEASISVTALHKNRLSSALKAIHFDRHRNAKERETDSRYRKYCMTHNISVMVDIWFPVDEISYTDK
jgi:hypothetical protein